MNPILQKIKNKDVSILRMVNSSMNCKTMDIIMPPITYLGSTAFSVLYSLIALFHPSQIINSLGIKTCITLFLSSLISRIIKAYVNRVRPFIKHSNLNIKKIGIDEYSFPSGHTTAAFSMAITYSLFFPTHAITSVALALSVGVSRIYLGVHYPTDVIAGGFLGTITSFLVFYTI